MQNLGGPLQQLTQAFWSEGKRRIVQQYNRGESFFGGQDSITSGLFALNASNVVTGVASAPKGFN